MTLEEMKAGTYLLVIQCNASLTESGLIAFARHRICDIVTEETKKLSQNSTVHVLYTIHVPRRLELSFVSFQGHPWICYHIDNFWFTDRHIPIENVQSMSEVFKFDAGRRLRSLIHLAACNLHDSGDHMRSTERVQILLSLMNDSCSSAGW